MPADDDAAWTKLNNVINEKGPIPEVFKTLLDQLTSRYPCICSLPEEDVDDGSPTAGGDREVLSCFGRYRAEDTCGYGSQWHARFERLMAELQIKVWIGDATEIQTSSVLNFL